MASAYIANPVLMRLSDVSNPDPTFWQPLEIFGTLIDQGISIPMIINKVAVINENSSTAKAGSPLAPRFIFTFQ
jgi:hypothetical protein